MKTRKLITWLSVSLFMGTVLTTTAMAGMGGRSSGGGMGGSGNGSGDKGINSSGSETVSHRDRQSVADLKNDQATHTFEALPRSTTGSMKDGGVEMELEPHSYENGVFRVKFFANTHTVNLGDYDMMDLMHLQYEDASYRPAIVDRMRGHHARGEVEFHIPRVPEHFRIIVSGLPNEEQRVFEW